MVTEQSVKDQLKRIGFNHTGWGRTEVRELHRILLPDEEILEVVNGFYEGGFALLIATDVRVLLVDKKPMNYLTVEDLRFDMINEMDYSHRVIGANISIATGSKTLKFTSLNQPRLRQLIGHVQHSMAQAKKQQTTSAIDQKTHLEQINQQLQAYLVAQQQNQIKLQEIQQAQQAGLPIPEVPEPVKPSPELSDFLYAQSLLAQYQAQNGKIEALQQAAQPAQSVPQPMPVAQAVNPKAVPDATPQMNELYAEGFQEVFGKQNQPPVPDSPEPAQSGHSFVPHISIPSIPMPSMPSIPNPLEINPMRIAYSKLPMALRNRKFGRPSFHAHSDSHPKVSEQAAAQQPAPAEG